MMEIKPLSELEILRMKSAVTIDEAAALLSGGSHSPAWVAAKEELANEISSGELNTIIDYARFTQTGDRLRLIEMEDFLAYFQKLRMKVDQATTEPAPKPIPMALISKSKQQDSAILDWLKGNNFDPMKLPKPPKGKAGVKRDCRNALEIHYKMFSSTSVFNTAWDRLRQNNEIADCE